MSVFASLFPREAKKEQRRKAHPGKVVTAKRRLARQSESRKEREEQAKLEKLRKTTAYNLAKAEKAESDYRRRVALRKARSEHPVFKALSGSHKKRSKKSTKPTWLR